MSEKSEEMVPLSEAENEVKVVTQRLALLHLAYGRTLVDEFGWEKGKQLVMNAIKESMRTGKPFISGHDMIETVALIEAGRRAHNKSRAFCLDRLR